MKKRILSILTAVCIAASTIFGGAIPAKAVTTRVMTTKFEIYQGSTKVAETSFAPSNSFNDVGYDYAKKWNVTLQGDTEYKLVVSWGTPLYEGYGAVSAQVVDMYAGGTFTDTMNFAPVKSLKVSNLTGLNTVGSEGTASCTIKSDGYGFYPMHFALDNGDGGSNKKFKANITFQASGKEGDASSTVPQGSNIKLTAATLYSEHYYNFSWTKNGTPISGETGKTYTVPAASPGDVYVATISRKPNSTGCTGSESWTHTFTVSNETFSGPTKIDGIVYNGGVQKLFNDGTAPSGFEVYYRMYIDSMVVPGYTYDEFWNSEKNTTYYSQLNNGNAGTYTIRYFIANSPLYGLKLDGGEFQCLQEGSITCSIAQLPAQLNTAPAGVAGLEYNGQPQNLVTAGTATNGTVQYRIAGGEWSDSIPTATNAGTYTVEYRVKGKDGNYATLENENYKLTVSIAAADKEEFAVTLAQEEFIYNGNAAEPTAAVTFGNTSLTPGTDYTVSYENNIKAGTATAKFASFNWDGTIDRTFKINPKELTNPHILSADKTYDGKLAAENAYIAFDGIEGTDDVMIAADIAYSDANAGTDKTVTASNLQLAGADGANYTLTADTVSGTGTISPMDVSVSADYLHKIYGSPDPELIFSVSPALPAGESLKGISLSRTAGENIGDYDIIVTVADGENPNYKITPINNLFAIYPAPLTLTVTAGQSKVYGTQDPEIAYTITSGQLYGTDSISGAVGREAGETADKYPYTLDAQVNMNYLITLEVSDMFVIEKATPALSNVAADIAVDKNSAADVTVSGTATANDTDISGTFSLKDTSATLKAGENSVEFIFTPTDTTNYNTVEGTVKVDVVTQKMIDVQQALTDTETAIGALQDKATAPENQAAVDAVIDAVNRYNSLTDDEKAALGSDVKAKLDQAVDAVTAYKIIHGADGEWTDGSSRTLGFTANGLFSLFKEVRVVNAKGNSTTLVRDVDYTAQQGSTVVTLRQSYLDKLSVGKYKLEVVYDVLGTEHIADCSFTVKAKPAKTENTVKSVDGGMDMITVDGKNLAGFDRLVFEYTISVPYEKTSVTFGGKTSHSAAKADNLWEIPLNVGENVIVIKTTAENEAYNWFYTITVNRAAKAIAPQATEKPVETPQPSETPAPTAEPQPTPTPDAPAADTSAPQQTERALPIIPIIVAVFAAMIILIIVKKKRNDEE